MTFLIFYFKIVDEVNFVSIKVIKMKKQLNKCPACDTTLEITRYTCPKCNTICEGHFSGCSFCALSDEDRLFALVFLQTEGNMKDVERLMGISYPTVKSRLARLNRMLSGESGLKERINAARKAPPESTRGLPDREQRNKILNLLAEGSIDPTRAAAILRGEVEFESVKDETRSDTSPEQN